MESARTKLAGSSLCTGQLYVDPSWRGYRVRPYEDRPAVDSPQRGEAPIKGAATGMQQCAPLLVDGGRRVEVDGFDLRVELAGGFALFA